MKASGIFNGNARIREYVLSVQSDPNRSHIMAVCRQLCDMLTDEAYKEWLATTPDDDAGFDCAAEAKLAEELAAHEVQEKLAETFAADDVAYPALMKSARRAWFIGLVQEVIGR